MGGDRSRCGAKFFKNRGAAAVWLRESEDDVSAFQKSRVSSQRSFLAHAAFPSILHDASSILAAEIWAAVPPRRIDRRTLQLRATHPYNILIRGTGWGHRWGHGRGS